ncbi:MAG: transglycosylase SLT domain-containing protein [Alistipes sp.]|nr:transglycosylase SLT domain-containing protein [Candidatus Minthomonas equi]
MHSVTKHPLIVHTVTVLMCGICIGILVGILAGRNSMRSRSRLSTDGRDTIRAAVAFRADLADRLGYATGMEYALLQKYGDDEGVCVDVRLTYTDSSILWSELEDGRLDILLLDGTDSSYLVHERAIKCCLRSGLCRWAVRRNDKRLLVNVNHWLGLFMETPEFSAMRTRFSLLPKLGLPKDTIDINTVKARRISPYDDIIRQNARILEWDWRLLASLICQESKFVLSMQSSRNAVGLMQVRPLTAEHYGLPLSFEPSDNIHLGTLHLLNLLKHFSESEFTDADVIKFSLAAYNCGESRIRNCIEYARTQGYDASNWAGVESAILEMREKGMFNGTETLNLVNGILERYEVYCKSVEP